MKYAVVMVFAILYFPGIGMAQDSLTYEEQYQQAYLKRIKKSHIKGFYIPKDLPDAMRILDEIVDAEGKQKFAVRPDSIAVNKVFFSFGRWININWGMELGSRLTVALNHLGVSYPDDMIRLIMYAYHRHLNQQPMDIDLLVNRVIEERMKKERIAENLARDEP